MVIFRCDAGAVHGLGHLSRCVTIADAVVGRGGIARLYVHADENLRMLAKRHHWHAMPTDASVAGDLAFMQNEISGLAHCVAVIDSKSIDNQYVAALQTVGVVVQIVDGDPRGSVADLVINNHLGADRLHVHGSFLLGPVYNTIKPGYFAARQRMDRRAVLITMGGEDPHNHTGWILRHLGAHFAGRPVIVVIGPFHPDPGAVVDAAEKVPNAEVHRAPPDLVALAARSEIAISAGGITCYELAAAGIATVAIAIEDHQKALIEPLADCGAILALDGDASVESARMVVGAALGDAALRDRLMRAGVALFPEPGAPHIADALFGFKRRKANVN